MNDSRRLRRPSGYSQGGDVSRGRGGTRGGGAAAVGGVGNYDDPSRSFGLRSNTVTLFPGDFRDHDSIWEDAGSTDLMDSDTAFFDEADFGQQQEQLSAADLIQQALREKDAKTQAQKQKWIENSKPPIRKPKIDPHGRAFGKGGRKAAKATVFIQPGLGEIVVNRQDFIDYFGRRSDREHVLAPLVVTETLGQFDVQISVRGGGLTGQAGAARLGVANALNAYNPDLYRPPLKRQGFLERDARKVERKKIGRVKARKSPQWVRR